MNLFRSCSRRTAERGSTTLEFAMFASAGLLLLLAGTDLVSYLRSRLMLDQVSGTMASLVTSYQKLYTNDFLILFDAAQEMAGSIAVSGTNGATVITGMTNSAGTPTVAWRQQAGSTVFVSAYGGIGERPRNLPDDYALPAGSSLVAVEVFSSIHPWVLSQSIMGTTGNQTVRSATVFQPRASLLSEVTAGNRP